MFFISTVIIFRDYMNEGGLCTKIMTLLIVYLVSHETEGVSHLTIVMLLTANILLCHNCPQ